MASRRPRSHRARSGAPAAAAAPSGASLIDATPATPVDLDRSFAELGVPAELVRELAAGGIDRPFPIQAATLPDSLAGRDVLGRGRTGSGKTLAFVLPLLTRLAASRRDRRPGRPRALVLAPTRELATQIETALRPLARPLGLKSCTVFGGVAQGPQATALRNGVDIVVACPGRLEDLIGQGHASLDSVEVTVLDEADHMADLGFLPVVKRLLDRTPDDGQRLLFSATLDNGIDVIVRRYLTDPVVHSVDPAESPVDAMEHHVLHVRTADRLPVLVDLASAPGRTIVFTRTKHRAKQLTRQLNAHGVPAVEMHGNLAQAARTRNLAAFADGRATALVATDIAARGIHVDDVALVVHADPPIEHKAYLHRSGRTARAGADGTVVTLATESQHDDVRQLARKAGISPTVTTAHPGHPVLAELAPGTRTTQSAAEIAAALAPPVSATPARPAGSGRRNRNGTGRPSDVTATGEPAGRSGGRRRTGGQGRSGSGGAAGSRAGSRDGGRGSAPAGRRSSGSAPSGNQRSSGGGRPTGGSARRGRPSGGR